MRSSDRIASYELRVHRTPKDVGIGGLGAVLLSGVGWAVFTQEALSTGRGVVAVAAGSVLGLLAVLGFVMALCGPAVRLRVDAVGVAFDRGRLRSRPRWQHVPWGDVEAFVTWKSKGGRWVGVVACEAHRRHHSLGGGRSAKWFDRIVGLPVAGTVALWDGPADELDQLHRAVAALAPHIPRFDPTTPEHRQRLHPNRT